jgi:hypothetical protein
MVAKLAISIARKIGAVIFLLPEDITQVRARLVCQDRNQANGRF